MDGFAKAVFKSFSTKSEADSFIASKTPLAVGTNIDEGGRAPLPHAAAPANPSPAHGTAVASQLPSPHKSAPLVVHRAVAAPATSRGDQLPPPPTAAAPHAARGGNAVHVYVDGSCLANGQGGLARGGYGGFYGNGDPRNFSEPLTPGEKQTNNRGELKAAIHAVQQACESDCALPLCIHTDSRYVIDGITKWIEAWRKRNYANVENDDLWRTLDASVQAWGQHYAERSGGAPHDAVAFIHVKGHSGVYGNEQADRLAVQGSMIALQQTKR